LIARLAFGRKPSFVATSSGRRCAAERRSLIATPTAMPATIQRPPVAPDSVARSTSAHARPSGYGSSWSASTIRRRLSGIIASTPRTPPRNASPATCRIVGTTPHMKSAGIVKIVPVASDELALPIVCARFASRRLPPPFDTARKSIAESTAIGIEVETVSPAFRPR
jgi:hypothetical protein